MVTAAWLTEPRRDPAAASSASPTRAAEEVARKEPSCRRKDRRHLSRGRPRAAAASSAGTWRPRGDHWFGAGPARTRMCWVPAPAGAEAAACRAPSAGACGILDPVASRVSPARAATVAVADDSGTGSLYVEVHLLSRPERTPSSAHRRHADGFSLRRADTQELRIPFDANPPYSLKAVEAERRGRGRVAPRAGRAPAATRPSWTRKVIRPAEERAARRLRESADDIEAQDSPSRCDRRVADPVAERSTWAPAAPPPARLAARPPRTAMPGRRTSSGCPPSSNSSPDREQVGVVPPAQGRGRGQTSTRPACLRHLPRRHARRLGRQRATKSSALAPALRTADASRGSRPRFPLVSADADLRRSGAAEEVSDPSSSAAEVGPPSPCHGAVGSPRDW